jgi:LPS-assembly protein
MKQLSAIALICLLFLAFAASAQEEQSWEVLALSRIIPGTIEGKVDYDPVSGTASGTNGLYVRFGNTSLIANSATVDMNSGDVAADGDVRIESGDALWVGDHIRYNFKTRQMRSEQFRTGQAPVFAGAINLTGDGSNRVYKAQNAFITTDDVYDPAYRVRASRVKIIPGKSLEMWHAVLYAGKAPVFYFPYYKRNLGRHANNFLVTPGYNSRYGGYLLGTYRWFLGDELDGRIHLDYRSLRGPGAGPDVSGRFGRWGNFNLKYYYTHDERPNESTNIFPQFGNIPHNRQRFTFEWQATPATNLNLKALINYQSDPLMLRDFNPGDYNGNPQPNTFIEANKYWDNWSLDALSTPRVNGFFNQIERLPDVRLTGYRQQVFDTPVYYDGESSIGWYRRFITSTNGTYPTQDGYYPYSAMRADTFHQLTLPWTFFNWLNITPNVGGRLTYYSRQVLTNAANDDVTRGVFNTGIGASFKASRLWAGATNSLLQMDGLRHIIEPSVNYVFVPQPSTSPDRLVQMDSEQPSLLLLPVHFPDYNSIDSIDTRNVMRLGLRNSLQTKRDGQLDTLLYWNLLLDWRLDPQNGQDHFDDLYSAIAFKPRSWITFESQTRNDLNHGNLNLAFQQITLAPSDRWSWGVGYWYLRNGAWGNNPSWSENQIVTSTIHFRLSDNWGFRMTDHFNLLNNRLQEQLYTVYRDFRSWTSALTFRVINNPGQPADFTVAVVLSLKASPSMVAGEDVVNRYRLVGE